MGFRLVPKSVTLNGIMAIILHYFEEIGSFCGQLHCALRVAGLLVWLFHQLDLCSIVTFWQRAAQILSYFVISALSDQSVCCCHP